MIVAPKGVPPCFSDKARNTPGTGLGLSIADHTISTYGGTVTAANGPHGGAVFTVKLPPAPPEE